MQQHIVLLAELDRIANLKGLRKDDSTPLFLPGQFFDNGRQTDLADDLDAADARNDAFDANVKNRCRHFGAHAGTSYINPLLLRDSPTMILPRLVVWWVARSVCYQKYFQRRFTLH